MTAMVGLPRAVTGPLASNSGQRKDGGKLQRLFLDRHLA
jgi:hypothetical protein